MSELIVFLLMPGFSLLDFAAIAEPLRSANRLGGELYRWKVLSADGHPVEASNGMSVAVDGPLQTIETASILFVVLLQQTDLSIMEVSLASGFESPSYFARCYKKRFERSPRDDRQATAGTMGPGRS
jgi:transcriptional regulator GlxA family with amidase domain